MPSGGTDSSSILRLIYHLIGGSASNRLIRHTLTKAAQHCSGRFVAVTILRRIFTSGSFLRQNSDIHTSLIIIILANSYVLLRRCARNDTCTSASSTSTPSASIVFTVIFHTIQYSCRSREIIHHRHQSRVYAHTRCSQLLRSEKHTLVLADHQNDRSIRVIFYLRDSGSFVSCSLFTIREPR